MVFIIDDILIRTLLGSHPIQAFDMLFIMEQVRNHALKSMYDVSKINDQIKELRMLYELSEVSDEDYEKQRAALTRSLEYARKVEEMCRRANMGSIDIG